MPELNTTTIRIFLSVAETLNFSRTAEQLYFTPQTVSQHIKKMEQSLGAALFTHTGGTLALTACGKEYVSLYREYMRKLSELRERASAAGEEEQNPIRLVITERFSMAGRLRMALLHFRRQRPDIRLEISHGNVERMADAGRADVGVICSNRVVYRQDLETVKIAPLHEKLIVSPLAEPARGATQIDPECWGLPLYIQAPTQFNEVQREYSDRRRLKQYGLAPRTVIAMRNMASVHTMLAVQPCATVSDVAFSIPSGGNLVFDLPEPANSPWLSCIVPRTSVNENTECLIRFIQQELGDGA